MFEKLNIFELIDLKIKLKETEEGVDRIRKSGVLLNTDEKETVFMLDANALNFTVKSIEELIKERIDNQTREENQRYYGIAQSIKENYEKEVEEFNKDNSAPSLQRTTNARRIIYYLYAYEDLCDYLKAKLKDHVK